MKPRIIRNLILISAASLGLGACTDGYGYGGVGYGSGYYGDDYYGGGYYGGSPYYGWYDGWYYPGNGYYVYDRRGTRRSWNDGQRRYWEGRRGNWNDGNRNGGTPMWRGNRDGQPNRGSWNDNRGTNPAPRVINRGGTPGEGRWRGNRDTTDVTPAEPNAGGRAPWRGRRN